MEQKIRVLLADSDREFCSFMKDSFSKNDKIELVAVTSSGRETINIAENLSYDLLLIDLMLPDIDGLSVIQSIGENKNDKGIFVISAFSSAEAAAECSKLGVSYFMCKPLDIETLTSL